MLTRGKVFALCSILLGIPPPSSLITSYASERLLRCSKHMVIYLQMHKARNTMIRGLSEGNCLLKVEPEAQHYYYCLNYFWNGMQSVSKDRYVRWDGNGGGVSPDTALSQSTVHSPHSTLTLALNTLNFFCPHSFFFWHTVIFLVHTPIIHSHSALLFLVGWQRFHIKIK